MDWVNRNVLIDAGVDVATGRSYGQDIAVFTIAGGKPGFDIWKELAKNAGALGGWPLLAGDPERKSNILSDLVPDQAERERILETVPQEPPIDALAASKRAQHLAALEYVKQHGPPSLLAAMSRSDETNSAAPGEPDYSEWPEQPPGGNRLPSSAFFRGAPLTECWLLIVRTSQPSDVPAYLQFGDFNDCPPPEIHVAFLRDWHRRFGAVPVAVTRDVIELYLPSPVMDRHEAFKIAAEQYAYAPDLVHQGTETIDRLAMEIWGSPCWYFWWD